MPGGGLIDADHKSIAKLLYIRGGGGVGPQTAVGLQSCFLICMYNLLELLSVIMFWFYSAVRCSCPTLCAKPALWLSSAGQVRVFIVCLHARQWQPCVDTPVVSLYNDKSSFGMDSFGFVFFLHMSVHCFLSATKKLHRCCRLNAFTSGEWSVAWIFSLGSRQTGRRKGLTYGSYLYMQWNTLVAFWETDLCGGHSFIPSSCVVSVCFQLCSLNAGILWEDVVLH